MSETAYGSMRNEVGPKHEVGRLWGNEGEFMLK